MSQNVTNVSHEEQITPDAYLYDYRDRDDWLMRDRFVLVSPGLVLTSDALNVRGLVFVDRLRAKKAAVDLIFTHDDRLGADPNYDAEGEETQCLKTELRHARQEIKELRELLK